MTWLPFLLALLAAGATAAATPRTLRWLSAPASGQADAQADAGPPGDTADFGRLATWRFASLVGALALTAGLVAYGTLPPAAWLAWTALVAPGALAIAIDGATTWIPYVISWVMTVVAAAGVGVWALVASDPWIAGRAGIGAVLTGGFFHLFHRLSRGGIGYADVRLMAVVGAVAAPVSTQVALWAPMFGAVIGAVWGVVRAVWKGRGEFAYGPSLWTGPFVALVVAAATG